MKALTIHQPFASLLACGAKSYETRSWSTNHRGPLAIHAAKTTETLEWLRTNRWARYRRELRYNGLDPEQLPLGSVVAVGSLVQVRRTDDAVHYISHTERQLGNWSAGRYAWQLNNVRPLDEPVPARGQQRLWNFDADKLDMEEVLPGG